MMVDSGRWSAPPRGPPCDRRDITQDGFQQVIPEWLTKDHALHGQRPPERNHRSASVTAPGPAIDAESGRHLLRTLNMGRVYRRGASEQEIVFKLLAEHPLAAHRAGPFQSPFVVSLSNHNWGLRQAQAERQGTTLSQQWKGAAHRVQWRSATTPSADVPAGRTPGPPSRTFGRTLATGAPEPRRPRL